MQFTYLLLAILTIAYPTFTIPGLTKLEYSLGTAVAGESTSMAASKSAGIIAKLNQQAAKIQALKATSTLNGRGEQISALSVKTGGLLASAEKFSSNANAVLAAQKKKSFFSF